MHCPDQDLKKKKKLPNVTDPQIDAWENGLDFQPLTATVPDKRSNVRTTCADVRSLALATFETSNELLAKLLLNFIRAEIY